MFKQYIIFYFDQVCRNHTCKEKQRNHVYLVVVFSLILSQVDKLNLIGSHPLLILPLAIMKGPQTFMAACFVSPIKDYTKLDKLHIFNRQCVAGAVLQKPLALINILPQSVILCKNIF